MARVTLMDVARHCGVSRATVSLVLNDSPLVAAKTRDRVREGMTELGYVYNRAAASLRTQHSDAIGVVLTNITNPYFAEFAAGLQDTLASSGTVPLLAVSNEDRDQQHRLIKSLVERNVDGIVLVPAHGTSPTEISAPVSNTGMARSTVMSSSSTFVCGTSQTLSLIHI